MMTPWSRPASRHPRAELPQPRRSYATEQNTNADKASSAARNAPPNIEQAREYYRRKNRTTMCAQHAVATRGCRMTLGRKKELTLRPGC